MKKISRSNRRIITISILVSAALVIASIWITALVSTKDLGKIQESNATAEIVERTLTGKNDDQNRKDALATATMILNESLKSKVKFEERMEKLDSGDDSVVTKELKDRMRFVDIFKDTKTLQANTYQSLITLSTVITMSNDSQEISPLSENAWAAVYVDSETGNAFVPMSIYSETNSGFSLHLIYDGSDWKLSPYSLIDSVKLSSNVQSATTQKTE